MPYPCCRRRPGKGRRVCALCSPRRVQGAAAALRQRRATPYQAKPQEPNAERHITPEDERGLPFSGAGPFGNGSKARPHARKKVGCDADAGRKAGPRGDGEDHEDGLRECGPSEGEGASGGTASGFRGRHIVLWGRRCLSQGRKPPPPRGGDRRGSGGLSEAGCALRRFRTDGS